MAHILAPDPARELPIYLDGFHAGRDVGLRIALDAITAESARQEDAALVAALGTDSSSALPHEYAAGRLLAVARIVGATFRTRP